MKRKSVIDSKYNHYNLLDLTNTNHSAHEEIDEYEVIFKELEDDAAANAAATIELTKRRENTGPRIQQRKPGQESIFFKSIRFTQIKPSTKPKDKLTEFLDADDEMTENLLKSQGAIIGDSEEAVR